MKKWIRKAKKSAKPKKKRFGYKRRAMDRETATAYYHTKQMDLEVLRKIHAD